MQQQAQPIKCAKCQTEFTVLVALPYIDNQPLYSQLIIIHTEPQVCPNCGQSYLPGIAGIQGINLQWMPVEVKDAPTIVSPTPAEQAAVKKSKLIV